MARRTPNPRSRSQSPVPLSWTTTLNLSPITPPSSLTGDKILLPPTALEGLLSAASSSTAALARTADPTSWDTLSPDEIFERHRDQGQQLPHPLTFSIVNTANGKKTHAGVREFSADEGDVVLSSFLRKTLGVEDTSVEVVITAEPLPKGTFAKLQPLEPGYEEDWRPLLETHLRKNYTTLTVGDTLFVPSANGQDVFSFRVAELKPADAVCVVDTDLDVDIEPLDEEQARESLKRKAANGVTSTGGEITIGKAVRSSVAAKGYTHFQLKKWDKAKPVRVEVHVANDGDEVDLVISTEKLYRKPSVEEHEWGAFGDKYPKHVVLDDDKVRGAQELWISVYGYAASADEEPREFNLLVIPETKDDDDEEQGDEMEVDSDREVCSNCKQPIPKRTMFLHQNFCFRNNILCKKGCGQVFKRGTENLHWHCDSCDAYGTNTSSDTDTQAKHNWISHTPAKCGFCNHSCGSLLELASHKTRECPGKLILCQFCHLILPQEGDENNAATLFMTDLTPHEVACGSRTTDCHLCSRIVQLKQMDIHMRHHDIERKSKPLPRVCRNVNCARTSAMDNSLDLCGICNGPLYSASHDPDNSALARRVKRKYDMQLLVGCKKEWCTNTMCKTGRANIVPPLPVFTSKEAGEMSKLYSDPITLVAGYTAGPLHFCVDEGTAKRREAAEKLSMMQDGDNQGGWALEWCVKAVEETSKAGEPEEGFEEAGLRWLERWAVKRGEKV